jgi:hypothetical protein
MMYTAFSEHLYGKHRQSFFVFLAVCELFGCFFAEGAAEHFGMGLGCYDGFVVGLHHSRDLFEFGEIIAEMRADSLQLIQVLLLQVILKPEGLDFHDTVMLFASTDNKTPSL